MSLILDENRTLYTIRAYLPGQIQINEIVLHRSVIVSPTQLIEEWPPQTFSALNASHLTLIKPLNPALVIIGTGSTLHFPPPQLYSDFINHQIGVEIMDTRAACHTFNVLCAEGRLVVAALILT